MGVKFNFSNPLGFEGQSDFDHKTSKIKSRWTRVSKRYLNDKSPTHGREKASIFWFSAESFESDVKTACCCTWCQQTIAICYQKEICFDLDTYPVASSNCDTTSKVSLTNSIEILNVRSLRLYCTESLSFSITFNAYPMAAKDIWKQVEKFY